MRSLVNRSVASAKKLSVVVLVSSATLFTGGCLDKGFLDPTEMGAFNKEPLIVPVLEKLNTGVEEPADEFGMSVEPTAEDLVPQPGDYEIGANDLVTVQIGDLRGPGLDDGKRARVTDSGRISLPNIGPFKIAGMTEAQAEEAISKAYRDAEIIQNAQVTVIVDENRGRTFSLTGAVNRPGQYPILKSDFRLLDAFVTASESDVTRGTRGYDTIYVIRAADTNEGMAAPASEPSNTPGSTPDDLRPRSQAKPAERQAAYLLQATEPSTAPASGGEGRYVIIDGKPVLVGGGPEQPADATAVTPAEPAEGTAPTMPMSDQPARMMDRGATVDSTQPFAFNAPGEPSNTRTIRVPLAKLLQGEMKYNIVIRPGDTIFVPSPAEGVYYMGGHVSRVGVYALGNGNRVSLMDAIIGAGGLDPVAVPWRTQIIRRIQSTDKQVFATVDLTKIFNGEEPDVYLKKDDKVIVGTQFWAPFLASLRNGFRLTYGFGFLYDRNYYDNNNNNGN